MTQLPIQEKSLVNIAISRIKAHIANNGFQPGDKYLSEKELTDNLQVSRTVIREALISLQSIGLLNIRHGGGVYIDNQNLDVIKKILQHHYETHGVQLKELIETREVIELGALRLIIEKNTAVDFAHLRTINEMYYDAIHSGKDTRIADRKFHQQIIQATGNKTFFTFSEIINDYFSITNINLIKDKSALLQSYDEHEKLIEKIEARDLVKAEQYLIAHFQPIVTYIHHLEEGDNDGTHTSI